MTFGRTLAVVLRQYYLIRGSFPYLRYLNSWRIVVEKVAGQAVTA